MNKDSGHPREKFAAFNTYLSVQGEAFELQQNSCMCNGCYRNCTRNINKENKAKKIIYM